MQPFSNRTETRNLARNGALRRGAGETESLKYLAAMVERDVAAQIVAQIYLARPGDFLLVVEQHFFPLRDPSRSARNGKQHGEHGHRESHRLVDEAGIEVHVGIEAARHKVFVL